MARLLADNGRLSTGTVGIGREHGANGFLVKQRTTAGDGLGQSLSRQPVDSLESVNVAMVVNETCHKSRVEGPTTASVIPQNRLSCTHIRHEKPGRPSLPLVIPIDYVVRQQFLSPT
ncbi:hypothetical protein AB0C50_01055 [Micromonospora taraxaci]|uniref:hypothetical protein n=1 Tax=Micromonospora taraxaci TaxID=1316803 RepID=UPI0033FDE362